MTRIRLSEKITRYMPKPRATPAKGSPAGAPPRFSGVGGKRRLIESIRRQTLVANEVKIANALASNGELAELQEGDLLSRQGDPENDISLILHGMVSIRVNEREIAVRRAGTHVGELALVDQLAVRSATVMAATPTVLLTIPEHKFSRIASRFPELWRRIAVEIANRLRERHRFVPTPNVDPVLFIGSSSEGRKVVDAIYAVTHRWKLVPRPWTDGVFEASTTTIESLISLSHDADFAALVLTADDAALTRGKKKRVPRDNVIFELGLLMGALGRERVFILKPRNVDIRIPSDLLGVTWLDYRHGGSGTMTEKLRPTCKRILARIKVLGPK